MQYKVSAGTCFFYIDDPSVALKLSIDGEIRCSDGTILPLIITEETPKLDINSSIKEKFKLILAKRYVQETKALNLSNFHYDPGIFNLHSIIIGI